MSLSSPTTSLTTLSLSAPVRRPPLTFPDHLSYSSLSDFLECPMKWAMGRLEKRVGRVSWQSFLGNTVHHVLDAYHQGTITSSQSQVLAYYKEAWERQKGLRQGIDWFDIDWGVKAEDLQQRNFRETYLRGKAMLEAYFSGPHRLVRPLILPSGSPASECNIEIPLLDYGGRRLKSLVGVLDVIEEDESLADYKTKMKHTRLSKSKVEFALQPLIYALIAQDGGFISPAESVKFRYRQLLHDFDRRTDTAWADYDARVELDIPTWRIDKVRQMQLPAWVQRIEDLMDRVAEAKDPRDVLYLDLNIGDHCDYCAYKDTVCPMYVKSLT